MRGRVTSAQNARSGRQEWQSSTTYACSEPPAANPDVQSSSRVRRISTKPAPIRPSSGLQATNSSRTRSSPTKRAGSWSSYLVLKVAPVMGSRRANVGMAQRDLSQSGRVPRTGHLPSRSPRCPKRPMSAAPAGVSSPSESRGGVSLRRGPKKKPKRMLDVLALPTTPIASPSVRSGTVNTVPSLKAPPATTTPVLNPVHTLRLHRTRARHSEERQKRTFARRDVGEGADGPAMPSGAAAVGEDVEQPYGCHNQGAGSDGGNPPTLPILTRSSCFGAEAPGAVAQQAGHRCSSGDRRTRVAIPSPDEARDHDPSD